MAENPKIILVKRFLYRGALEEWSNGYHFVGPPPANPAAWLTLINALIQGERPCVSTATSYVRAYGYADGSLDSTYAHDFVLNPPVVTGSYLAGAKQAEAGDAVAMIRWPTAKRNSRGKTVYLRKYFHDVYGADQANPDKVVAAQYDNMNTFAAAAISGTTIAGFRLCGPDGTLALAGSASPWITTRTLKRRGKRPPT